MLRRTKWLAASMLIIPGWVSAQGISDSWFDVPEDQGALAVVIRGDVEGRTFIAKDAKMILDEQVWMSALPVVRQYRLEPGQYTIEFPESLNGMAKSVTVDIKDNTLSVLEIAADSGVVSAFTYGHDGKDKELQALVGKYYGAEIGRMISPVNVSPDAATIKMNIDLPWPIKPPKP